MSEEKRSEQAELFEDVVPELEVWKPVTINEDLTGVVMDVYTDDHYAECALMDVKDRGKVLVKLSAGLRYKLTKKLLNKVVRLIYLGEVSTGFEDQKMKDFRVQVAKA